MGAELASGCSPRRRQNKQDMRMRLGKQVVCTSSGCAESGGVDVVKLRRSRQKMVKTEKKIKVYKKIETLIYLELEGFFLI